ncbi:MAG: helix-hairpin-helix domain-containing protein [Actinomycetota bacterium]
MNPVAQPNKRRDGQQEKHGDAKGLLVPEDARVVARRRAFLVLEAHRETLAARPPRRVRVRRRYEDLCLVKMVTRLQRDYLSQPTPGAKPSLGGTDVEYGIADWARPWGSTFLLRFQADLDGFDLKLKASRRWLSAATQRKAEARASERFASITAGMASKLKAAEFALPSWACGRQLSRDPAPRRAPRRAEPRPAFRRGAAPRVASGRAAPRPVAPGRDGRRGARDGRLDLNQASFAELRSLNLSITQSHRLLAYRKRVGGYESIQQLDDVPGFPKDVRERLKRQVIV